MRVQPGFFDIDERLKRLSDLGDQLEAFAGAVDFEIFRADLVKALAYSDGSQGVRPPFDPVCCRRNPSRARTNGAWSGFVQGAGDPGRQQPVG